MQYTCPGSCESPENEVSMSWTIWEGGLGEQPSSKVRALLLPAIFSRAGPQQLHNRNFTQSSPGNVCYTHLYTQTYTHNLPWTGNWTALWNSTRTCINTGTFKGTSDHTCHTTLQECTDINSWSTLSTPASMNLGFPLELYIMWTNITKCDTAILISLCL